MLHKSNLNDGALGFEPPACEPGPVGGLDGQMGQIESKGRFKSLLKYRYEVQAG